MLMLFWQEYLGTRSTAQADEMETALAQGDDPAGDINPEMRASLRSLLGDDYESLYAVVNQVVMPRARSNSPSPHAAL